LFENRRIKQDIYDIAKDMILDVNRIGIVKDYYLHGIRGGINWIVDPAHIKDDPDQILMTKILSYSAINISKAISTGEIKGRVIEL
jgi:hypothetical protein